VRVLAFLTVAFCALASGACSTILGLEDPTADFGDDGGPRELVSIAVGPDPLILPIGVSLQLTATGMFDDGSSEDITAQTEFSAEAGGVVTITPTGLAQGVAEGQAQVTAKLGQIEGNATARVTTALPDRITLSLGDFRMAQLQRVRLHAIAVLTDSTMLDVTASATYSTDNAAVAAVGAPGEVDAGSQAGMATISAGLGAARAGTVVVTVTAKQCRPVINEFQTGTAASADDEWVEILNPCTAAIDVNGWTLVHRGANTTGTQDSNLMMTLTGQLAPGELKLFAGPTFGGANDGQWTTGFLGQANGGIALRMGPRDTGPIADALTYGLVAAMHPFTEGTSIPAMVNDRTAQRLPFDGRDDDSGSTDFQQVMMGSPRTFNVP
jgi:hypothetical protein